MKHGVFLASFLLLPVAAQAQTNVAPTTGYGQTAISSAHATVDGGAWTAYFSNLLGLYDRLDVRSFGATADGTIHTVSATLGVSTAAALQAYKPTTGLYAGVAIYANLNKNQWVKQINLPELTGTATGSTAFNLGRTITVSKADSANAADILVSGIGIGWIKPGMQACVATSANGMTGCNTISTVDPQGKDGVNNGFLLSNTPSVFASVGDTFVISPSFATLQTALSAGKTVSIAAYNVPVPDTITAVNQNTGVVTLSAGMTAAVGVFDGVDITIPYSDAEVAAMSMDTVATEAAIDYAANHQGGIVRLPGGLNWNQQIQLPASGQQQNSAPGYAVDLQGPGEFNQELVSTDLGFGQAAVACPLRITVSNCYGDIRDLGVIAANTHYGVGQSVNGMSGFALTSRRSFNNISAEFMMYGLQFFGDQTHYGNATFFGNYYGLYLDFNDDNNLAENWKMDKIIAGNNAMAGFAISPNLVLAGTPIDMFTQGAGPYGFFKETGGGTNAGMQDMSIAWYQCEITTVACIGEDRAYGVNQQVSSWERSNIGQMEGQVQQNSFFQLQNSLGQPTAEISAKSLVGMHIGLADVYNPTWLPGAEGVFNVSDGTFGVEIVGNIPTLISGAGGKLFGIAATNQTYANATGWSFVNAARSYHAHVQYSTAALNNNVLSCTVETSLTAATMSNCGGTANDDPQGVQLETETLAPNLHLLLDRGILSPNSSGFTVAKAATFNTSFPQIMCTAASGQVQPGQGRTCANGVPVGTMVDPGDGYEQISVGSW